MGHPTHLSDQDVIGIARGASQRPTSPRGDFGAARRHSARVRALKIAIPVGTAAAAALLLAALFNPFASLPGLSVESLGLSGSRIAMQGPRLTGFRRDAQPYEVTAVAAFQDVSRPTVIELKDMKASMAMDDRGTVARLQAAAGVFDTTKERLELSNDIRITTNRGDEAVLLSASVDLKAGTATTRDPVRITTAHGVIEAESMELADGGRTAAFVGRVRTQFDRALMPAQDGASAPARFTDATPSR